MKKNILLMFAAVLAIVSISAAAESAKPVNESAKAEIQTTAEETPAPAATKAESAVSEEKAEETKTENSEKTVQPVEAEKAATSGAVASKVEAPQKTAARRPMSRQEIRSMPILDRPNRPGHFYGNTVRRRHSR